MLKLTIPSLPGQFGGVPPSAATRDSLELAFILRLCRSQAFSKSEVRTGLEGCWPCVEVVSPKGWLLQHSGKDGLASAIGYHPSLLGNPSFLLINICRLPDSVGALSREGESTVQLIIISWLLPILRNEEGICETKQLLPRDPVGIGPDFIWEH